jgi:hypothetical protein
MCGPSGAEKSLAAQSASFASLLQSNYSSLFGNQMDTLQAINKSLSPILAAGPNQQGMSAQELAAQNTAAINNAAAAARNARQSVANYGAGRGNASGLVSGVQKQLQGEVASASANQLATAQNQITQQNYALGRENYWRAAGGMQALGNAFSPNAAASASIGANKNAFGEANTIQQQVNAEQAGIAGGIASIALPFISGGISNLGPGESTGEAFGSFLSGGLSNLG